MKDTYKALTQVNEFMLVMGQDMPEEPIIPTDKIRALRLELVREENQEIFDAHNLVDIADGLCDLLYVTMGAFTAYGFKPELVEELFDEVQASNMSKVCQSMDEAIATMDKYYESGITTHPIKVGELYTVVRTIDGKVLKSINWKEPDLKSILERHGVKC